MKRTQMSSIEFVKAAIGNANEKAKKAGKKPAVPTTDPVGFKKLVTDVAAEFDRRTLSGSFRASSEYKIPGYLIDHAELVIGSGSSPRRCSSDRRAIRPPYAAV